MKSQKEISNRFDKNKMCLNLESQSTRLTTSRDNQYIRGIYNHTDLVFPLPSFKVVWNTTIHVLWHNSYQDKQLNQV